MIKENGSVRIVRFLSFLTKRKGHRIPQGHPRWHKKNSLYQQMVKVPRHLFFMQYIRRNPWHFSCYILKAVGQEGTFEATQTNTIEKRE
jgi:hypothetical protein